VNTFVIQMMMMMTEDDNNCDNDDNRSVTNTIMNELSLLSSVQHYYYAYSFIPLRGDSAAVIDPLMTSCISLRMESIASQNRSEMMLMSMMMMSMMMMMIMIIIIIIT